MIEKLHRKQENCFSEKVVDKFKRNLKQRKLTRKEPIYLYDKYPLSKRICVVKHLHALPEKRRDINICKHISN